MSVEPQDFPVEPEKDPDAPAVAAIDDCLSFLFDAMSRRRIADKWAAGRLTGEDAMRLLADCDLIEFTE